MLVLAGDDVSNSALVLWALLLLPPFPAAGLCSDACPTAVHVDAEVVFGCRPVVADFAAVGFLCSGPWG